MLTKVKRTNFAWLRVSLLACGIATSMLLPGVGHAQADPKVEKALADLKAGTARLGGPRLEHTEVVGGTVASALHFGRTKINNNFEVVDEVVKRHGGTATLFAKWSCPDSTDGLKVLDLLGIFNQIDLAVAVD